MEEQIFCANCGSPLPPASRYCPRCGASVVVAALPQQVDSPPIDPPNPPPALEQSGGPVPEGPRARTWFLVPLIIAIVAILTLALLSLMPLGGKRSEKSRVSAPPAPAAPGDDGRIVEMEPTSPEVRPYQTETVQRPRAAPAPRQPEERAPERSDARATVSQADAAGSLLDFIASNDIYGIDSTCVGLRSLGYENVGYTFQVVDRCEDSRSLGRWRVDARNGDLFRQRPDGRYLAP